MSNCITDRIVHGSRVHSMVAWLAVACCMAGHAPLLSQESNPFAPPTISAGQASDSTTGSPSAARQAEPAEEGSPPLDEATKDAAERLQQLVEKRREALDLVREAREGKDDRAHWTAALRLANAPRDAIARLEKELEQTTTR